MSPFTSDSSDFHICLIIVFSVKVMHLRFVIVSFLIVCICPVGATKHTQRGGGDRHCSHWREPSQEKHQSLWTHNTALHLVLRDAQVITMFERMWPHSTARVKSSSCNSPKTFICLIWVCEWWCLWPGGCVSATLTVTDTDILTLPVTTVKNEQEMLAWIDTHLLFIVINHCLLTDFVNRRRQM